MLTDAEKIDVRRFAGYALVGDTSVDDSRDMAYSWVSPGVMQTLFHRLNSMSLREQDVLRTKYLPILNSLEDAVVSAGANLDTDIAAVWTRNKSEVQDRTRLFNQKRRDMCAFIGIKPGPYLGASGVTVVRA